MFKKKDNWCILHSVFLHFILDKLVICDKRNTLPVSNIWAGTEMCEVEQKVDERSTNDLNAPLTLVNLCYVKWLWRGKFVCIRPHTISREFFMLLWLFSIHPPQSFPYEAQRVWMYIVSSSFCLCRFINGSTQSTSSSSNSRECLNKIAAMWSVKGTDNT